MNDDFQQSDVCTRDESGRQSHPELCCCLAMDENGDYADACYRPALEIADARCNLFKPQLRKNDTRK
jgi:hypothetical protein